MALTRKSLKAMGLSDEQVDSIVEMHTETVDGLKEKLKQAEEKAEAAGAVQKELDELKKKGGNDYLARAEKAEKELSDLRAAVAAEKDKAAKEKAADAYFEGKNILGTNLTIAKLAAHAAIEAAELDKDGSFKDTAALDALVGGDLAGLVCKPGKKGANPSTPPAGNGNGGKLTREEIMREKDTSKRQRLIAENLDLFRK